MQDAIIARCGKCWREFWYRARRSRHVGCAQRGLSNGDYFEVAAETSWQADVIFTTRRHPERCQDRDEPRRTTTSRRECVYADLDRTADNQAVNWPTTVYAVGDSELNHGLRRLRLRGHRPDGPALSGAHGVGDDRIIDTSSLEVGRLHRLVARRHHTALGASARAARVAIIWRTKAATTDAVPKHRTTALATTSVRHRAPEQGSDVLQIWCAGTSATRRTHRARRCSACSHG